MFSELRTRLLTLQGIGFQLPEQQAFFDLLEALSELAMESSHLFEKEAKALVLLQAAIKATFFQKKEKKEKVARSQPIPSGVWRSIRDICLASHLAWQEDPYLLKRSLFQNLYTEIGTVYADTLQWKVFRTVEELYSAVGIWQTLLSSFCEIMVPNEASPQPFPLNLERLHEVMALRFNRPGLPESAKTPVALVTKKPAFAKGCSAPALGSTRRRGFFSQKSRSEHDVVRKAAELEPPSQPLVPLYKGEIPLEVYPKQALKDLGRVGYYLVYDIEEKPVPIDQILAAGKSLGREYFERTGRILPRELEWRLVYALSQSKPGEDKYFTCDAINNVFEKALLEHFGFVTSEWRMNVVIHPGVRTEAEPCSAEVELHFERKVLQLFTPDSDAHRAEELPVGFKLNCLNVGFNPKHPLLSYEWSFILRPTSQSPLVFFMRDHTKSRVVEQVIRAQMAAERKLAAEEAARVSSPVPLSPETGTKTPPEHTGEYPGHFSMHASPHKGKAKLAQEESPLAREMPSPLRGQPSPRLPFSKREPTGVSRGLAFDDANVKADKAPMVLPPAVRGLSLRGGLADVTNAGQEPRSAERQCLTLRSLALARNPVALHGASGERPEEREEEALVSDSQVNEHRQLDNA